MSAINAAMNLWRTQTCVTFKKRTTESAYAYFHIGSGYELQNNTTNTLQCDF